MNDQAKSGNPWLMSSTSLIAACVMCAAAAALSAGASWLAENTALEQGKAQAALLAASQALQRARADSARFEENLQMFNKLKQSGFTQMPHRLLMLEVLEIAALDFRKNEVKWEMAPSEKLKTLTDGKTGATLAQLMRVPMKLSVSGVHEEEWLALLARLQDSGAGYFTADSCVYERTNFTKEGGITVPVIKSIIPASTGGVPVASIGVLCNLSWLYVVAEGTAPAPAPAPKAPSP